ncbi:MAG TPA: hypothetical protein VGB77_21525 [Abditibacteriaceae bacterium]
MPAGKPLLILSLCLGASVVASQNQNPLAKTARAATNNETVITMPAQPGPHPDLSMILPLE